MSLMEVIGILELIAFVVGAWAALFPLRKHFKEQKLQNQRIEDALLGTPETPTLPGTPSLFFQVKEIKTDLSEVKRLTAQLKANGGKSLFDVVNQTAREMSNLSTRLEDHLIEEHGART